MTAADGGQAALLVVAAVALLAAGLRVAACLGARGIELALSGFTLAAAAAAVEALGLGLEGWGGDSLVLGAAAVATWGVVRALTPPAAVRRARVRVWAGAAAGAVAGWIVFQLRHPFIGGDGLIYHLPIASAWVQNGRPGSVVGVLDGLPVANYPVTNEVIVGWGLALSRSWVWASIWTPLLFVAMACGGWVALRELEVPVRERALAVAAVCVLPLSVFGLGGPTTDIATTAWLCVAAGLACASRRTPGLVYPAILAAALCLGTKTTPALLIVALAVVARGPLRAAARQHRGWLAAAAGVGVVVGGIWPLRNLIVHGSPLWPLVSLPGGDPVPAALAPLRDSFLMHARTLVGTHYEGYLDVVAGGLVLGAAAVALPLARRSRAALWAGAAAGAGLLAWGLAPYTGIRSDDFAVGATRYLLPALAACALAAALAARGAGPRLRGAVTVALAASIAWSCWRTVALGYPYVPSAGWLIAFAAAGAPAAWAWARWPRLAVVAAIACLVGFAVAGNGYVARHAGTGLPDGPLLRSSSGAGLLAGSGPIATAPGTVVMLRGDHFAHALSVIGAGESCPALRGMLRAGAVVLESDPPSALSARLLGCLAGVTPRLRGYYDVFEASTSR
jgi:hypothetical protein